jgi:nicotinate-nucleotide pyrophosphorylase
MTAAAGAYAGLDRARARERILEELEASGALVATEPHALAIGTCYRCRSVVEPLLSTQWFVRTKPLAEPAIAAVRDGRTRFFPEHWSKTYFAWMENIRDWCVSRQLWWGHRIPAWYCDRCPAAQGTEPEGARAGDAGCKVIVSREEPAGCPGCGGPLRQDEDVLDTWFSSGLWPFSTLGWPEKTPELERYYPTSVLVTGFDIIFFWVARMMMFGLRFTGEVPFRDVYVHGLVRDEYGDKMSKTKGNVKDPLELLATYGTDALRFTLAAQSAMGRDIRLSVDRIDGNRSFANKIWNAARFILLNVGDGPVALADGQRGGSDADRWIRARLARCIDEVREAIDGYRFNDAASALYRFFWNEFCDWYVELAKMSLTPGSPGRATTVATLVSVFEAALRLLHPLMPFLTEELWHALPGVERERATLLLARYPRADEIERDGAAEARVERLVDVVRALRNLRSETSLPPSREIALRVASRDAVALDEVRALAPGDPHAGEGRHARGRGRRRAAARQRRGGRGRRRAVRASGRPDRRRRGARAARARDRARRQGPGGRREEARQRGLRPPRARRDRREGAREGGGAGREAGPAAPGPRAPARGGSVKRAAGPGEGAPDPFAHPSTLDLVRRALAEDVGRGDVTTSATVPRGTRGTAVLATREDCVVAGLPLVELVLGEVHALDALRVRLRARDGAGVRAGAVLAEVTGELGPLLTGERVLLNVVQALCGVATVTRRFVDAVAGTGVTILDTRKTTPGFRLLQKYAVRAGGGANHRFGLDDGVLVKDNHVAACGGVREAIRRVRESAPLGLRVEVECDRLAQVEEALAGGADVILLDNMKPEQVREARRRVGERALLEVSGGVTLDTVRAFAEAGPDFISVGRLTHSAPAIDLGLDVVGRAARRPSRR